MKNQEDRTDATGSQVNHDNDDKETYRFDFCRTESPKITAVRNGHRVGRVEAEVGEHQHGTGAFLEIDCHGVKVAVGGDGEDGECTGRRGGQRANLHAVGIPACGRARCSRKVLTVPRHRTRCTGNDVRRTDKSQYLEVLLNILK